jgi:hypothetical protein
MENLRDDPYVDAIDDVKAAALEAHAAIERLMAAFSAARAARTGGSTVTDIVRHIARRGGRQMRLATTDTLAAFENALTAYRAVAIRVMVDNEHLNFSEVGDVIGVSRQMVARLYRRDLT